MINHMKALMHKFFSRNTRRNDDLRNVTSDVVRKHKKVLQSLKDHDEGKKTISTSGVERDLSNI